MSALLVEDLATTIPVGTPAGLRPRQWRHVERGPQARPRLVGLPGDRAAAEARPVAAAARPVVPVRPAVDAPRRPAATSTSGWQLTERGIAVVTVFFLALVATAAVVLVTSFLAVSDAPQQEVAPDAAALVRS